MCLATEQVLLRLSHNLWLKNVSNIACKLVPQLLN